MLNAYDIQKSRYSGCRPQEEHKYTLHTACQETSFLWDQFFPVEDWKSEKRGANENSYLTEHGSILYFLLEKINTKSDAGSD